MKKLTVLSTLLGASVVAQAAYADSSSWYYENNPATSSFTLTLSGACSGKITLPVTQVYYGTEYVDNGTAIDRDGMEGYLYFSTSDSSIYAYGYNYAYTAGEKITESVKGGKHTIAFNVPKYAYSYIYSLANGSYDSQITCKDGGELSDQLYAPDGSWTPYFNWYTTKVSGSVSHTNSVSSPGTGEYKAKFSASGTMELPGQCAVKGTLYDSVNGYTITCAPPKSIKIKMTISAQGTSQPD